MEVITVEKLIEQGRELTEAYITHMPKDYLLNLLKDSPLLAQVRAEGEAEGQHQVMVKNIARALAIRFEADMTQWQSQLEPLSLEQLDHLAEIALTSTTLTEFETVWQQINLPDKTENHFLE